jgi:ribosome-associated toxin RatA of RatAB toxin-antitoxin module
LEFKRSVLVPHTAEDMFDLIEHAEAYPQFLPWCVGATVFERSEDWVAARLDFSYLQFRFGFQTRNAKHRPEWLKVRLVEGPFRRFQADWHLKPIGDQGCRIDFDVAYEISDGLLDRLARPAVERVSRSMVNAFMKRAELTLPVGAAASRTPAPAVGAAAAPARDAAPEPAVEAVTGAPLSTPLNSPGTRLS